MMWPTQIWWFWVSTKDFFIKLAIEGVPERLRGPVEGERSVSLPGAHIIVITTRFFRAALTLLPPPPESVVHANAYRRYTERRVREPVDVWKRNLTDGFEVYSITGR